MNRRHTVLDTVHPHACGEHSAVKYLTGQSKTGSSPRLWGTLIAEMKRGAAPCPAVHPHACGEHQGGHSGVQTVHPHRHSATSVNTPVHPHACGEHSMSIPASLPINGSSPRLWGTCNPSAYLAYRFIACEHSVTPTLRAVHPHACGEHTSHNMLIYRVIQDPYQSTNNFIPFLALKFWVIFAPFPLIPIFFI